ncbi:LytTR family transcriptional regulator DNA-binding domain-containing protein [Lactobacillus sp. M0398]|uniref:LytTR family transcriptional regulator DNA-binding domain-containing protein n=1 Tax=unclassified Lactobacillus TaxID=2620435 RepID=UPI0018DEAC2B|nr:MULTISPECIES: LytTR family transcriptional regulator DNA-binding domain-containing protein [unclassified Lactobacillus]MBI0120713.1 LytTR family transcriptional regulator DNA-binding domain-containing protein [Lactobacillus sp. M0398]MBI0122819.1 LytTR family transcriptional regulator DNA-binding domain-containing protein [Lactobacillus sp. W8174]MBI0135030.1 LytTR family transcriptional regulator DNA-binding domain-containing protein [Lactobacillus sp. W8173]
MRILVVDDEPLARTELSYLIKKSSVLNKQNIKLYEAEDIKEAQGTLLKYKIDLLFLDISLNEENGFELADELKQLSYSPMIVFATAYDNYAVKAFDVGALDYVLKPFEQERVDQALQKAVKVLNSQNNNAVQAQKAGSDVLSIELEDRNVVIKKLEVIAATVNNGVLTIETSKQKYETRKTLAWLKERLTDPCFLQVHRNAIVNIEDIKEVQPWFNHTLMLIMNNDSRVQVGRSYRKELNQKLGL